MTAQPDLRALIFAAVREANAPQLLPMVTIRSAIAAFRRTLIDRGRSERHARDVAKHCKRVCLAAKIETIAALTEAAVVAGIGRLRRVRPGREGNKTLSANTANHYRNSLRGFARWLAKTKQLPDHRLALMEEYRDGGGGRVRRELSIADVEKLLRSAEAGPRIEGFAGVDRAWLYRVALGTGFRRGELSSLTPASFHLADAGVVVVEAKFSKRRKRELQPVPTALADALRTYLATKPAQDLLWPMTKAVGGAEKKTALMVRRDLERAGIPYRTADGVADFHALRVAYISWLARVPGVTPKALQQAARHSSITLTLDVYAKVRADEVVDAVSRLPTPGGKG